MAPLVPGRPARAAPMRRSLHALDALNFFMADVQGGLGPPNQSSRLDQADGVMPNQFANMPCN